MAKNKKIKKPGILAEFKQFITRGNVIDMATGVIVASAFTKIVTSLTNSVFLPLVNYIVFLLTGEKGIKLITILNDKDYLIASTDANNVVTYSVNPECIYLDWGVVVEAILNFILIAAIIFIIIKVINSTRAKLEAIKAKVNEEEAKKEAEAKAEADRIAAEEAAKAAILKAAADKEKAETTSTNELLIEIINLLNK